MLMLPTFLGLELDFRMLENDQFPCAILDGILSELEYLQLTYLISDGLVRDDVNRFVAKAYGHLFIYIPAWTLILLRQQCLRHSRFNLPKTRSH